MRRVLAQPRAARRSAALLLSLSCALVVSAPAWADDGPPQLCPENDSALTTRCATTIYRFDEGGGIDQPFAVGITPDGATTVVGGLSAPSSRIEYTLAGFATATGQERWRFHWSPPDGGTGSGYRIALSPDGTLAAVTGQAGVVGSDGSTHWAAETVVVRVSDGHEIWEQQDTTALYGYRLVFSPDSKSLYIGGEQYTYETDAAHPQTETGDDWVLWAYDARTGHQLWRSTVSSQYTVGNNGDQLDAMSVSPDGRSIAVAGRWADPTITMDGNPSVHRGVDWATQVFDASTGARQWITTTIGGFGNDYPHAVAWSPDNATVVTGGELQPNADSTNQGTVEAFSATDGSKRWEVVLPVDASGTQVSDVTVSRDGTHVLATGEDTINGTGADYLTRSLSMADGSETWRATYAMTGSDTPEALTLSPDGGTVYVTGESEQPANGFDATTVAYRVSDGTQRWLGNYAGPNPQDPEGEILESIGRSDNGRYVAVAMRSPGTTTSTDMAVVVYDTATDGIGVPPVLPEAPAVTLLAVAAIGALAAWHRTIGRRSALLTSATQSTF